MTGGQDFFRRRGKRGWGLRARIIPGAGRGRDRRARAEDPAAMFARSREDIRRTGKKN
nr:MAG TPA: hypothetical protein [Caudoviricetes sp.]